MDNGVVIDLEGVAAVRYDLPDGGATIFYPASHHIQRGFPFGAGRRVVHKASSFADKARFKRRRILLHVLYFRLSGSLHITPGCAITTSVRFAPP